MMPAPLLLVLSVLLASALASGTGTGTIADPAADLAAARALQQAERWAASESLATAALEALERAPAADSLAIADGAYLFGIARWRRAGYADGTGIAAASRALGIRQRRLGADHLAVAEAHALLARFLLGTDRADSAVVHVGRAIAIRQARLAPDDTLIARTYDQLAVVHRDRRDFRAALAAWERAIAIRRQVHGPEHPEVARLLAQTGVPWMELGDLHRAREVLEGSIAMFDRTVGRDFPARWIPLNILADVEARLGDRTRAMDLQQEAVRVTRVGYGENARETLTALQNLANELAEFADYAGAITVMQRALPHFVAQYGPNHPRTLISRIGIGYWSARAGDLEGGLRELRIVDSVFAARPGPVARDLAFTRVIETELLIKTGRIAEARAMAERMQTTTRAVPRAPAASLLNAEELTIMVAEATGDTAGVERARTELVRLEHDLGLRSNSTAPLVRYYLAHAARWLGRGDEAWQLALEADRLTHETVRNNLRALPDRVGLRFASQQDPNIDQMLDLCAGRDAGDRAVVWDRLVRSRGLVRAELAQRRTPPGLAGDTAVVAAHRRWIAAQRALARRTVSAAASRRDSVADAELARLREASEEAAGAYGGILAARGATLPQVDARFTDVHARLAPGQALVSFVSVQKFRAGWDVGDTSIVHALVTRSGDERIELLDLGLERELAAVVAPWRNSLATPPGTAAAAANRAERESRRLGRIVRARTWDRIAPHLDGVTDVYVVGEGAVLDLPWHALPDGERGYLVEAGPRLHLLNAERDLLEAPRARGNAGSLLAVGAPDFDRAAERPAEEMPLIAGLVRSAPDPCSAPGVTALGPLPGAGAEAADIARTWRADRGGEAVVLTGAAATEQAFKDACAGREVLHLATHGVVAADTCAADAPGLRGVGGVEPLADARRPAARPKAAVPAAAAAPRPESPWLTRRVWLALAGANRAAEHDADENEGFLTAEEIVTLDLVGTDWVVLSACHSGLADAWSREGTLGMRRAFGLAGARTVIASQWAVEDEATREWMERLYASRAGGAGSAAEALEAASRSVLATRRGSARSTHPFYWAAFSAVGE